MPQWLDKAVFYEIYPQTFFDSNNDGIGDINGIVQKLDYIKDLGCNAIWMNPCFDSPFKDAGYDVRDYRKVAPRYGTNDDLFNLFAEAHRRGMKIILDLVPGHTSEEHQWFQESKGITPNEELKNRHIWTDSWYFWGIEGLKFIAGEAERDGCYIINFFKSQPALNYGFLNRRESWQLPPDHPDCIATREAMKDIMRFWLKGGNGHGCDGFRVDMADSLVKFDDDQKSATSAIWKNVRAMFDSEFPEAALVSEWSNPPQALKAGFHVDFLLDHGNSGYRSLVRNYENGGENNSYFKKDGNGGISCFLDQYLPWYNATKNDGYISLITGNHDTPRISHGLDTRELMLAYGMIFTMPGVPFMYYGDEIGMKYLYFLSTKEGGYGRTGSRTPFQWCAKEKIKMSNEKTQTAHMTIPRSPIPDPLSANMGFSAAKPELLYLPVDADPMAPNVEDQEKDAGSLLNTVKAILRLRHSEDDLGSKPNLEIIHAPAAGSQDRSFIYRRASCVIGINPSADTVLVPVEIGGKTELLFAVGNCSLNDGCCKLESQSFGVWKIREE